MLASKREGREVNMSSVKYLRASRTERERKEGYKICFVREAQLLQVVA